MSSMRAVQGFWKADSLDIIRPSRFDHNHKAVRKIWRPKQFYAG